jgi:hypothetical protein
MHNLYAWVCCTCFECKNNLDRNYKNRNICILSDSQAAIKALDKHHITSKLVWNCHQSLTQLAEHIRVQVIWMPGHEGIVGNETADQLARIGSEHPFTGPEPACIISTGVAKKVVRACMNRNHKKHWEGSFLSVSWCQCGISLPYCGASWNHFV